jgi:hypothetical protein
MNLGELNQIEEGVISTLKSVGTGKGGRNVMIQDIFIKDFMQDAMVSLKNAIKGGLVQDPKKAKATNTTTNTTVAETDYHVMNNIFETIIQLQEDEKMSVSDFMMNWFATYMNGVNWRSNEKFIRNMVQQFADRYPYGNTELKNLGRTAFALSKTGIPAGAPEEFKQSQQSNGQNIQKHFERIKEVMDELAKANPELYNKFIKTLQPVKSEPPAAGLTSGLTEQKNHKQ